MAWKAFGSARAVPLLLASLAALGGHGAAANARTPERIYATTCGYCHGHDVGPIIRGRQLPAAAITDFVRRGYGAMPAFRPTEITNDELKGLASWVAASKPDPNEHGQ